MRRIVDKIFGRKTAESANAAEADAAPGGEGAADENGVAGEEKAPAAFLVAEIDEGEFPEDPPSFNPFRPEYMKQFRFLPVSMEKDSVLVAMIDPADFITREVIAKAYGMRIVVKRASEELVNRFRYRWHEAEADMSEDELDSDLSAEDHLWGSEHLKDIASEGPVISLVDDFISQALRLGVSDIHFEPRKTTVQVRYRIDGVLHDQGVIPLKYKAAITSRIKLMAKMDIAEMRLPQDGRIKHKEGKVELDIRVSSIPVHYGESLVLRLLRKEGVQLELSNIGFPDHFIEKFKAAISLPYGMLLVTGPTGSGKTTTLYGALNTINTPDKKIVTVEDPVEYQLEGVNQVQVQSNIGLTFAGTLRSFLRHDPDVMLIGEIRDGETAEIAVQSALTGHMVFSTLHTNDAAGAITRLEDMGVERFMISSCLVGVLAQRLVRKVCPHCKEETLLSDEKRALLVADMGIPISMVKPSFFRGVGCHECGGTGYSGRMAIFEFLKVDEAVQREIVKGSDRNMLFRKAVQGGMVSLRMNGIERVNEGLTTYEEVLRVTR